MPFRCFLCKESGHLRDNCPTISASDSGRARSGGGTDKSGIHSSKNF